MSVMLLTEHNLEFLSLKGGCTVSSESALVKMPQLLEITCSGSFGIVTGLSTVGEYRSGGAMCDR